MVVKDSFDSAVIPLWEIKRIAFLIGKSSS